MTELHIEQELTMAVLDVLDITPLPTVTTHCPHCGLAVRYPKIARSGDVESLRELVRIADKYIDDKGITTKMLSECLATASIAIAKRKDGAL